MKSICIAIMINVRAIPTMMATFAEHHFGIAILK
jgi:hypothetical protein